MASADRTPERSKARGRAWMALAVGSLLVLSLVLSACGSSSPKSSAASSSSGESSAEGGSEASAPSGEIKIATALNGPKNDESFNQTTYEGLQVALKEFPSLKLTSVLENEADEEQRTDALNTLAPLNNLVLAASSSFAPQLEEIAPNFPKTYFLESAGAPERLMKNVTGFNNDWGAPLYIAGIIAAHMTKTDVVGFIGGQQVPATIQGQAAFDAAVKSVNPKIKVLNTLTGDFNNVTEAKAATTAQLDANADVIYPFLDAGIAGSFEAGKESGKNPALFNQAVPKCEDYPNSVGTGLVNYKVAVSKMIRAYVHKTLKPGAILLDLQEPEIQTLELCPKYKANKEIASITKTAIEEVNDGKRKIPAAGLNPRPNYPYSEGFKSTE